MNRIFLINGQQIPIKNKDSIINHFNYLFSNTDKHNISKETKNNFYILGDPSKGNSGFLTNPRKSQIECKKYVDTFKNKLVVDISYFFFYVVIDDFLITNILDYENSDIVCIIPDEAFEQVKDVMGKEQILKEMEDLLNNNNKLTVINYRNLDNQEFRKVIEETIQSALYNNAPSKSLLSISHNDQDSLYHVHRILE